MLTQSARDHSRASVRGASDGAPEVVAARQHVVALKGIVLEEVEKAYNDKLSGE